MADSVILAVLLSLPIHDMQYGPQATFIAEFTGRLRYSGASLGYHLASITAGGPAPLIATFLFAVYTSSVPVAIYMAICAAISIVSAALLEERSHRDMSVEYDEAEAGRAPMPAQI